MQTLAAFDEHFLLVYLCKASLWSHGGQSRTEFAWGAKRPMISSNTYCLSSRLPSQNKQRWRKEQTNKEKDLREYASLQHSGPPRLHSHVSDVKKLDGKIKVDICRHRQWCKFGVLESSSSIKVLWNLFYINHYLTVIFVFLSLLVGCSDNRVISKYSLLHSHVCSGDQYKPFEPKKNPLAWK